MITPKIEEIFYSLTNLGWKIDTYTKNDICCVCPPHVVDVMIKNGKPYLEISGRAPDQLTNEEKQLFNELIKEIEKL